jgi:F-type H+-transporting ATPase subunit a
MLFTFASESAAKGPHVSLPAEQVFSIFGFPISNALVFGIIGYGLVLSMLFFVAGRVKKGNKNRFVSLVQWIFEALYTTVEQVLGDKVLARKVAPLVITMFFFILIQYWLGILPVTGPVAWDGIPIFRSLAADLNTTFALAAITMVAVQYYAIKKHGFFGNLGRYFRNPAKDVAGAFEGILELVAEFSRFVGLSLRLFGNVFAGEILLMMIAFLTVYASPLLLPPFYIFELFIGAVQAYIFFMLTVVFISLGVATHGHDDESSHATDNDQSAHSLPVKPVKAAATSGN